jgi:DNA-binding cell septation regulator SpoVG
MILESEQKDQLYTALAQAQMDMSSDIKISEIKINKVESSYGLVGFASLIIEDAIFLSSIGIFSTSEGGYRLTYPLRKNTRQDLNYFFPINNDVAKKIELEVIKKYKEEL